MPSGVVAGPPTLVEAWWQAQAPVTWLRGVPPSRASLSLCPREGKRPRRPTQRESWGVLGRDHVQGCGYGLGYDTPVKRSTGQTLTAKVKGLDPAVVCVRVRRDGVPGGSNATRCCGGPSYTCGSVVAGASTRHAAPSCAPLTGIAAAVSRRGETATSGRHEGNLGVGWSGTVFGGVAMGWAKTTR
jgi:hypothetical protein